MDFRNSSFSRLGLCSTVSNRIFAKYLPSSSETKAFLNLFYSKTNFHIFEGNLGFSQHGKTFDNLFLTNLTQYANYCGWIIVEDYLIGDKMKSWDLRKFKWPYISRCGHVRGIFGKSTKVKFYWKTSFLVVFISLASLH